VQMGPPSKIYDVPPPVGFVPDGDIIPDKPRRNEQQNQIEAKRSAAWQLARSPLTSGIVMYALLIFLIPNAISIYSISFTVIALMNPLRAAFAVNAAFRQFEGELPESTLRMYKAIFVVCQLVLVAAALYKVMKLGLLPVTEADWLYFYGVPKPAETVLVATR